MMGRLSTPDLEHMYSDILKGLSVHFDSLLITDILETARRFPRLQLGYALNRNQMTSKTWLVDSLYQTSQGRLGRVCVLGGWYGVLGALLLHDHRFDIERIESVDIDPSCEEVALSLNRSHVDDGRFVFRFADMHEIDYVPGDYDLIVNTSCEHLGDLPAWYAKVPEGTLLVMQSNNYFGIEGHVNCVNSLAEFKAQVPLAEELFAGELALKKYTRYMVIGRR